MAIEDNLPERFKRIAYHPSTFIYAWKKKDMEKLFDELMQSNIAIRSVEAWRVEEDEQVFHLIPLRSGDIKEFSAENTQEKDEEWFNFVERSCKETMEVINSWNLEKRIRNDLTQTLWYHFKFEEEK